MIKVRLTYVADSNEQNEVIEILKEKFEILNISKEYKGRGASKFNNLYIDLNLKKDTK
ncbi:hypothetical protein [Turicibacter sanguinis]|uniref:hypothetical protein n=1 Tax=Turicibacter sanguinis TaxID=154288 RepID=UPI001898FE0C|nr:hypothetical protein [Turicibacter sanguinis]